jgi:lipopolysaccharide export system protein LptA
MNWRSGAAAILAASVSLAGAHAAAPKPPALGKHNASAPIEVSANAFQADINAKTGTYVGNVIVKQGDFRLRADKVRVNVVEGRPDRIFATGNVIFDAPSGNAQGDDGVYEVRPRLITLTGHVVLTRAKNVMRGSKLTVNLETGVAQLGAGGTPGSRVQGLFTPASQTQNP